MSMFPVGKLVYGPGRTKQAFKNETDINKILAKAQKTGAISHLAKYQGEYVNFADVDDLLTAHTRLARGQEIFSALPSEVRKEFNQDLGAFFNYVNDPENKDRLKTLLPQIAKAGGYFPVVNIGMGGNPAAEEAAAGEAAAVIIPEVSAPVVEAPVEPAEAPGA